MYTILCTLLFVKIFPKLLYFLKENAKVAPAGHSIKDLLILPECRFGTAFYIRVKSLNRTRIIFIRHPCGCSFTPCVHKIMSVLFTFAYIIVKKAGAPAGGWCIFVIFTIVYNRGMCLRINPCTTVSYLCLYTLLYLAGASRAQRIQLLDTKKYPPTGRLCIERIIDFTFSR